MNGKTLYNNTIQTAPSSTLKVVSVSFNKTEMKKTRKLSLNVEKKAQGENYVSNL